MERNRKAILFDWGDTLMVDFPQYSGAMIDWPVVQAVPGAEEVLQALGGEWILAVATNAEQSEESQIWAALERAGLSQYLDKIYCYRKIGKKKPSADFFAYIQKDLDLSPDELVMVGDSFPNDIQGAQQSGIRGIWLNRKTAEERSGPDYVTIHDLSELPGALEKLLE